MNMQTEIVNLDNWLRRFQNGPKIVTEELTNAGRKSGFWVERLAKGRVKVWRGDLRRSINTAVKSQPLFVTTTVGSPLDYAKAKDMGRSEGARMPPVAKIAEWLASAQVGGDPKNAFAVARAIAKRGIPGNRFLTGSFEESRDKIRGFHKDVVKNVIRRLKAGA